MNRDTVKYAHGLSRIWIHMSFKVKYCHEIFIYNEVREECSKIFFEIAETHSIKIKSLGFDKNHVHLVNDLGKYSEPELRKLFKGISGDATSVFSSAFTFGSSLLAYERQFGIDTLMDDTWDIYYSPYFYWEREANDLEEN